MKDIRKYSVAGVTINMESDAAEYLKEYLHRLENAYQSDPDKDEIISDIEARLAELILSSIQFENQAVGLNTVCEVCKQVGDVEEITEDMSEQTVKPQPKFIKRRLYRDVDNCKIAGVFSGIAHYFSFDPVWLRLAVVVIPILLGLIIDGDLFPPCASILTLFYFVLWMVIPKAVTVREKLEMNGEEVSIGNIAGGIHEKEEAAKGTYMSVANVIGKIILFFLKAILALMILPVIAIFICVIFVILGVLSSIDLFAIGPFAENINLTGMDITGIVLGCVTVALIVGLITYVLICLITNITPKRKVNFTLIILIVILTVLTTCFGIRSCVKHLPKQISNFEAMIESVEDKTNRVEGLTDEDYSKIDSLQYHNAINDPSAINIDR